MVNFIERLKNYIYRYLELSALYSLNIGINFVRQDMKLRDLLVISPLGGYIRRLREKCCEIRMNERFVERPFVFRKLQIPPGGKLLDFGCSQSLLPLELACMGYDVIGIDIRDYEFDHPNFSFIKGNLLGQFEPESFHAVIAVSTVEHVGFGEFGEKTPNGDKKAIDKIWKILKQNGQLIITLPCSRSCYTDTYRVYNPGEIALLLRDFNIKSEEYFQRINGKYWIPTTKEKLYHLLSGNEKDNPWKSVNGVALIDARKIIQIDK